MSVRSGTGNSLAALGVLGAGGITEGEKLGVIPPQAARCLQCLIGNCVGEDIFVSLVEGASSVVGIVHGFFSYTAERVPVSQLSATMASRAAWFGFHLFSAASHDRQSWIFDFPVKSQVAAGHVYERHRAGNGIGEVVTASRSVVDQVPAAGSKATRTCPCSKLT